MREEKLNFGIIIRVLVSLLPILFGMPTLATVCCAYNIVMSFIVFGPLTTFASSLCAIATAMLLSSSFGVEEKATGLVIGLQAVLCAGGCIRGLLRKKDFYYGLALSTFGVLLPQFIYTNSLAHKNGMSLADMLVPRADEFKTMIMQTFETLQKSAQGTLPVDAAVVEQLAQWTRDLTVLLIPSALIISSMIVAYFVMWSISARLRRASGKGHSFSHIKMSRISVLITIALFFASAFTMKLGSNLLNTVTFNMLFVLLSIAFFAGMSFVDFYFRKLIPFAFFRIILHAIIALNFSPIYIIVALVDAFANFRKLPKASAEKGGEEDETEK